MIELVKDPVPVALLVFVVSATVGPVLVLQQTPRAVTAAPPSLVTFPPPDAADDVMPVIELVVTVGKAVAVVMVIWVPYAVPMLLVAYALI